MKFTISQRKANGRSQWCLDIRGANKRQRRWFKTKTQAETAREDMKLQVAQTGHAWASMEAWKRYDMMAIWGEVEAAGLTLRAVWEGFKANQGRRAQAPKLQDLITELVTVKRSAQRRERYIKTLEFSLKQFARGREEILVSALTLEDVEGFIDAKNVASRSSWRSRLSTLFKFAIRRGYIIENPCARLETISAPAKTPQVLSVEQVEACLKFLRGVHQHRKHAPKVTYRYALPWFVLSTFCGLRPEEAEQTTRADINVKEGWVRVEAQTSKVRQRRIFEPLPPAMRLLASVLKQGRLPIGAQARRRVIRRLRKHLGLTAWPKDVTRHTAATFWLAQVKSAGEVSEALGHSEKTLKKHYAGLVTREQTDRFWALCPPEANPAPIQNGA